MCFNSAIYWNFSQENFLPASLNREYSKKKKKEDLSYSFLSLSLFLSLALSGGTWSEESFTLIIFSFSLHNTWRRCSICGKQIT